jgi:hypothetical protein
MKINRDLMHGSERPQLVHEFELFLNRLDLGIHKKILQGKLENFYEASSEQFPGYLTPGWMISN